MLRGIVRSDVIRRLPSPRVAPVLRTVTPSLSPSALSYSTRRSLDVANGFEVRWRALTDAQREAASKEYAALEAQDWHTLSLEQKRASTGGPLARLATHRLAHLCSIHDCLWRTRRGGSL